MHDSREEVEQPCFVRVVIEGTLRLWINFEGDVLCRMISIFCDTWESYCVRQTRMQSKSLLCRYHRGTFYPFVSKKIFYSE